MSYNYVDRKKVNIPVHVTFQTKNTCTWFLKMFYTQLVKKKITIPSGALFKIPAKHLAASDLV